MGVGHKSIEEIDVMVLKDVNRYWQNYSYPFPVDQLRRSYHYHVKAFGHGNFNSYLDYLHENGKLFIDVTPAGRKVAMPIEEAARILESNGSLAATFRDFDRDDSTKLSRRRKPEVKIK